MYVVILAGGGGTRLWPLSRPERPKPFLPLVGEETLLQRTVARVLPLVASPGDIFVVTDHRYGHLVQEQAPEVRLLVEPSARDTAAAIALATRLIERPDDDVMVVLPADHWIRDEGRFRDVIREAAQSAAIRACEIADPLVTLGVQHDHPSRDYGYLRPDVFRGQVLGGLQLYPLLGFEEKPSEARARELVNMPGVAWNAGMFIWHRRAIRQALEKYTPLPMLIDQAVGSELALRNAYERVTPISIDKAVMEGAASDHRVVMAAMDVGWSDLGSWTALLAAIADGDGRGATGRVVQTGETLHLGDDDLVVRTVAGRLVVDAAPDLVPAADGTIVADGAWAHLAGAGHLADPVRSLLGRVERQEIRA